MVPPPPGSGMMDGVATRSKGKVERAHAAVFGEADSTGKSLFWFSVGIHFLLLFLLLPTLKLGLTTYVLLFAVLFAVLTAFTLFYFKSKTGHFSGAILLGCGILAAFYVLLPLLLGMIRSVNIPIFGEVPLYSWISLFLIILPFYSLFIGYHAHIPIATKWLNFWIIILVIFFVLVAVTQFSPGRLISATGAPAATLGAGSAINYIVTEAADIFERLWKGISIERWKNETVRRVGLDYYTGMVDDNEKTPVGLYIDNVRTIDREFYVGYPATIWADVRGKSFLDEIVVTPHCNVNEEYKGEIEPITFTIFGEEHDTLSCTFTGLEKGSYRAKIGASFDFETWAYVTYTFVDMDTMRSYEMQGKNINYELDIDPTIRSIFTNGPVMLGMSSMIDQPIGLDTQYNAREPVLGVTLGNLWTEGEVERVDEFIIQVPEDFKLVKCDRWYPETERQPFKSEEGYDFYKFTREEIGDTRQTFQSVTCRLRLEADPKGFLAGAQKIQRTFVAQARYKYKLEKSVSIHVRE